MKILRPIVDPLSPSWRVVRPARVLGALAALGLVLVTGAAGVPGVPTASGALAASPSRGAAERVSVAPVQMTPAQDAPEGRTYELVDTWQDKPWTLTAGRYGWTADISSTPDGVVYVLDNRMPGVPTAGRPPAIHVLEADGSPRRIVPVPGQEAASGPHFAQRLDAGSDGTVHVLSSGALEWIDDVLVTSYRVDQVDERGQAVGGFDVQLRTLGDELPNYRRYIDIAVRADGRVYLLRKGIEPWCVEPDDPPITIGPGENPIYSVDVFTPDGTLLESLTPPPMLIPNGVDVGPDGRVYILNTVPTPCSGQGGPGEPPEPPSSLPITPELAPPPRPDAGSSPAAGPETLAALQQDTDPDRLAVPGIIILEPDHGYREIIPWYGGEDIAAGPAGAFVSRNVEVFHIVDGQGASASYVEETPTVVGPTGHIFSGYLRRIAFTLDVPADGRLLAGMNHCYYQGFVEAADPTGRPATVRLEGALDAPELEGPAYPVRVAAADELAVLLGRMRITERRPNQAYVLTNMTTEAQTVQRWPLAGPGVGPTPAGGTLASQVGLCPDTDLWFGTDRWLTRDIAVDGETIYTIDQELLQKRPDDGWPSWTYWPGEVIEDPDELSFLGAVDADDGLVAVLDLGGESVVIVDAEGERVTDWPVAVGDEAPLPVDIALDGDRLYIADRARGRIVTRDLDGAWLGDFATHDGPESIAVGPSGDILMIGEGGYGLHYTPSGELVASWALPDRDALVRDIAVGPDHRVYVNFAKTALFRSDLIGQKQELIRDGGIWVFERAGRPAPPPPVTQGCVPRPDKWAHEPRRFPLGGTVDVSLTVDGWCPGRHDDAQLLFLLDTSRSMGFTGSLDMAKTAAMTMIAGLDPAHAEAGLVTFAAGPTLAQPFTRDLAEVRGAVARQGADGDTRVTGALEAAFLELTGERADPQAKRLLVVLTDGVFYDQPFPPPVIDEIHAAGIEVHVLVFPTTEYGLDDQAAMELVAGDAARVLTAPSEGVTAQLTRDLTGYEPEDGLFETITVIDKVPANMKYILDSAEPPAVWDPAERTLSWTFGVTPASETLEMTYTLQPLEVGTWPTNVWARGPYRDALGKSGQVVFPVPEVEVYELELTDTVYLPWSGRGLCLKPRAADIVLVMDASSSMLQPAAGGGTKIEAARAAATLLVDGLRLGDTADRVAVVEFFNDVRVVTPLSGKRAPVIDGLARLAPDPSRQGTRIDLGLRGARVALGDRRASALPVVILLSDGLQNPGGNGVVLTEMAALESTVPELLVYTIGLGDQIDTQLLRDQLATSPDRFYASPNAEQLAAIYAEISERLQCEGQ